MQEAMAADQFVNLVSNGTNTLLRITTTGGFLTGIGAYKLGKIIYASTKGKSKSIINNPAGYNIVTLRQEDKEAFQKVAKEYKLKFTMIQTNNAEDLDIFIRAEDAAMLSRIIEKCGINVISEAENKIIAPDDALELSAMKGKSFEEIAKTYQPKAEDIHKALNRLTDKDFSSEVPHYVASRTAPTNYIKILSEQATFEGKNYTKSYYTIYKDGKEALTLDDGRFTNRPKDYWISLKNKMAEVLGTDQDFIYFSNKDVFESYRNIYENKAAPAVDEVIDIDLNDDLKTGVKKFNEAMKKKQEIPEQLSLKTVLESSISSEAYKLTPEEEQKRKSVYERCKREAKIGCEPGSNDLKFLSKDEIKELKEIANAKFFEDKKSTENLTRKETPIHDFVEKEIKEQSSFKQIKRIPSPKNIKKGSYK